MRTKQPPENIGERDLCKGLPKSIGAFARWASEPAWRREGSEPDYRFSLANERTFLAWIRTALAVLAAAMLLEQLTKIEPRSAVVTVSLVMCVFAAALGMLAYSKWQANEQAMRHGKALPHSRAIGLLAVLILAASGSLATLVLVDLIAQ